VPAEFVAKCESLVKCWRTVPWPQERSAAVSYRESRHQNGLQVCEQLWWWRRSSTQVG
jgi:hypothetical protein